MEFYNTKMGHQFYNSDFPRMVKALEKIGGAMEKTAKEEPRKDQGLQVHVDNSVFRWVQAPSERLLREAEGCADKDEDDRLAELIMSEFTDDADRKTSKIVFDYSHATPEERRAIDGIFVDLTGWTFATILRRYVTEHQAENAWKAKEGYIIIQASDEGGWDYTLYTTEYELIDGGQVDEPAITAGELKDQLVKDFGWDESDIAPTDYDEVETAVTAVEEKKWSR